MPQPHPAESDASTDEIKGLCTRAFVTVVELLTYADKHPRKVKALREEFVSRVDTQLKVRLMKLFF